MKFIWENLNQDSFILNLINIMNKKFFQNEFNIG